MSGELTIMEIDNHTNPYYKTNIKWIAAYSARINLIAKKLIANKRVTCGEVLDMQSDAQKLHERLS